MRGFILFPRLLSSCYWEIINFLLSVIRRLMIDVLHWHGDDPMVRGYFAIFSVTMTLMIGRRREPALLINYANDILRMDNKI